LQLSQISPGSKFDFESKKAQLMKILETASHAKTSEAWKAHPMFGKMTVKKWASCGRFMWIITWGSLRLNG
jgi:prephenate dehydrogenase